MAIEQTIDGLIVNTPYDDAFRTLLNDCVRLLIPVINEIFGKHYSGDEEIIFYPNEHFINQQGGSEDKRITDSSFTIVGETEDKYVLECQSRPDSSMLVRIFEYITQVALDAGKLLNDTLEVTIPQAAVLFLRSNSKTPYEMRILMHTPGGDVMFKIPVIKMKDYTLEMIFEKKLYFLLPFFIFTHEDEFATYNADAEKLEELKKEYVEISEKLEKATADGDISYYYARSIIEMTKLVLENIAKNYENVRKGVDSVMGGMILEHESKTIHNEGRSEGRMEEKQSIAMRLYKKGTKTEEIAEIVDASVNLVKQWISAPPTSYAKRV